jgi:sugar O-acyltransferase (sialic acid O-acetyltransferase NeuD family)
VHWVDELRALATTHEAVCGLGTTMRSRFVSEAEGHGMRFATIVHPDASVSATATLGAGTIVGATAVVAAHARLGEHVLVNRGALVGHHTTIGDFASIMSGANVAGSCNVGSATFVAMGAVVLDRLTLGCGSVVAAGAVATKDVPESTLVMGVPARVVEEGIPAR